VCLVRIGSSFYAVADRCTHADVRLSEGDVDPDDCSVECWKHGSAFSLVDGEPQSLPATRPVEVFRVSVEGDEVVVHGS
jgi:3-phenylpropionate/trans-cinnamate dioxygenase ferredoxin subunit